MALSIQEFIDKYSCKHWATEWASKQRELMKADLEEMMKDSRADGVAATLNALGQPTLESIRAKEDGP